MNKTVGVVIGRFQTPKLHEGHRYLINSALGKHKDVLILLGVSPAQDSDRNPLNFETRRQMILWAWPQQVVLPLWDMPLDDAWSSQIDQIIKSKFPKRKAVLYGSRDSFLRHYTGRWPTKRLKAVRAPSATELRSQVGVSSDPHFREGIIYAVKDHRPRAYQAVDILIVNHYPLSKANHILLGRKETDPEGQWRSVGGFVEPTDSCLEEAAYREAMEEIGDVDLGGWKALDYIGSLRVDDWRYRREKNKIMTAVFLAYFQHGRIVAGDDLAEAMWFPLKDMKPEVLIKDHRPILTLFNKYKRRTHEHADTDR